MEAQEALELFLSNVLSKKKERYLGFIAKSKTRNKFLNAIYHELEEVLDGSKQENSLPESALEKPAFIFVPPNLYGERVSSLKKACSEYEDSFLAVSDDGLFGVYGPETFIDSRAYYVSNK